MKLPRICIFDDLTSTVTLVDGEVPPPVMFMGKHVLRIPRIYVLLSCATPCVRGGCGGVGGRLHLLFADGRNSVK